VSADQVPALEDQQERTLLAWRRTAGSLAAAGLLAGHFATQHAGAALVASGLVAIAALVAYTWLNPHARTATAGLSLVLGVVVLGALALVAVVG
jgi:uncharacterized membrane protein YidH (DUF202 family)